MSGGLRNFTSNPHYPVNRWVMTGLVLTGLPDTLTIPSLMGKVDWAPEAFTCPATLDRPGRLDFVQTARSLHWL